MAMWAFVLGYIVSSCIQVFVTRERMKQAMGKAGARSVGLATFSGFISSSCSFAALATSKSLFKKGAGLVPSLAFLLSSTNLVIELGIIIAIFLSWQFVVGEYIGGILLILLMWVLVKLTLPDSWEKQARERMGEDEEQHETEDWKKLITSREGWQRVASQYFMEWGMVWRDVTFGFTVAGIISAFVPQSFFTTLFVGAGGDNDPAFWQVLLQTLVGPLAAFLTFIGSMGNIPLASLLLANGVSFAGIMAFIFSDLVVFPVLRINAKYYGWTMALYILGVFLVALVAASLLLHYGFGLAGMLPEGGTRQTVEPMERFKIDYTLFLNVAFLVITGVLVWLKSKASAHAMHHEHEQDEHQHDDQAQEHQGHEHEHEHEHMSQPSLGDRLLTGLAYVSLAWLAGGAIVSLLGGATG
ncbi:putative permease [Aeoliella mucimassa]|uniref:Putative permease n=2 Tax=Aeoliella mucimassa TaxID=2527972 RepID=A0A518APX4_9BACT|nr:putative permease [Aeoliella mucimassa]